MAPSVMRPILAASAASASASCSSSSSSSSSSVAAVSALMRRTTLPHAPSSNRRFLPSPSARLFSSSAVASNASSSPRARPIPPLAEIRSGEPALTSGRLKPSTDTYYTTRPALTSLSLVIDDLTKQAHRALQALHVLPPRQGLPSTPQIISMVKAMPEHRDSDGRRTTRRIPTVNPRSLNETTLGASIRATQSQQLRRSLDQLARLSPLIAEYLGRSNDPNHASLTENILAIPAPFIEGDGAAALAPRQRAGKTGVDEAGRVWACGARKESSATVYIAPVSSDTDPNKIGEILINGQSVADYFSRLTHREAVLYPLRLTHLMGAFNVFVLTQGGGHSGQAGATAHGLARAIVKYFRVQSWSQQQHPSAEPSQEQAERYRLALGMVFKLKHLLLDDGVYKRDPRMVERKKPGKPKARKSYTWVKR